MNKSRLEAFSDGVFAIIITIMVLELKVPHTGSIEGLYPLAPVFLSYTLSFIYVGIYWNNHHHMLQAASKITGGTLWANLLLLFWLSLFPFTTAWMGEFHNDVWPTILYGFVLLLAACSYWILQELLIKSEGSTSLLRAAVGNDLKGRLSPLLYLLGIGAANCKPWIAQLLFTLIAALWLIPDRRIENTLSKETRE
jgi:uncharacterized membrane protein